MSSKHVEFYLPIVRTAIWPLFASYIVQVYFITTQVRQAALTYQPTSSESEDMLKSQRNFQFVQAAFFAWVHLINWKDGMFVNSRSKHWMKATAILCAIVVMIIVPIASLFHLGLNFSLIFDQDNNNQIRSWLIVYPLMGLLNIFYYFLTLHPIVMKNINDVQPKEEKRAARAEWFDVECLELRDEKHSCESIGIFISRKQKFNSKDAGLRGLRHSS